MFARTCIRDAASVRRQGICLHSDGKVLRWPKIVWTVAHPLGPRSRSSRGGSVTHRPFAPLPEPAFVILRYTRTILHADGRGACQSRDSAANVRALELFGAAWPSGKARDCKSLIPRFESGRRLQLPHDGDRVANKGTLSSGSTKSGTDVRSLAPWRELTTPLAFGPTVQNARH